MDILLIDERISKMETVKSNLLKLKKEHRQTTLQEVNAIISRLKKRKQELTEKAKTEGKKNKRELIPG